VFLVDLGVATNVHSDMVMSISATDVDWALVIVVPRSWADVVQLT
jgi:hypothetical protein